MRIRPRGEPTKRFLVEFSLDAFDFINERAMKADVGFSIAIDELIAELESATPCPQCGRRRSDSRARLCSHAFHQRSKNIYSSDNSPRSK